MFNSTPSIVLFKKEIGEMGIKSLVTLALTDLVLSFNVGKTMNQSQIVFAVESILSDYYFLKPTELKYCFDNAKKGRYGNLYDRIDLSVICEWIDSYLMERTDEAIKHSTNAKIEYTKTFDENIGKILAVIKFEPEQKEVVKTKDVPFTDVYQDWMRLFDKLRRNFEVPQTNGRFIYRYKKALNIEDFFNYKADQLFRVKQILKKRKL